MFVTFTCTLPNRLHFDSFKITITTMFCLLVVVKQYKIFHNVTCAEFLTINVCSTMTNLKLINCYRYHCRHCQHRHHYHQRQRKFLGIRKQTKLSFLKRANFLHYLTNYLFLITQKASLTTINVYNNNQ